MRWPTTDMFAVTVDGLILMNARALEGVDVAQLATKKTTFVGVVLTDDEKQLLSEHIYDATSEVASLIFGSRRRQPLRRRRK